MAILKFNTNQQIIYDLDSVLMEVVDCDITRIRQKNRRFPMNIIRACYCCVLSNRGLTHELISKHIERKNHATSLLYARDFEHRHKSEVDFRDTYDALAEALDSKMHPLKQNFPPDVQSEVTAKRGSKYL